ncbi:MAG: FtsQ-type POTRA domain-containing protein [Candidatus Pacebacteria bacterium]|nr:FtsQ-type POTRA domain-containing protein [Candidatus Paceibacterota bacterium]
MKSRRPQQKTKREKRKIRKKIVLIILAVLIIIGTGAYVMNHEYLKLEQIEIRGQKTLIADDVTEATQSYLDSKYFWIFSKSNIFIFNRAQLKKKLTETFPKIENIEVNVEGAEKVIVTIGERSAHSLWCIDKEYESVFDEECYFADSGGLLYARAPYFSGSIYMKMFIEPYEEGEYIGSQVKDEGEFNELFEFLNQLEENFPMKIAETGFDNFRDVRISLSRINNVVYPERRVTLLYNEKDDYETILRNVGIVLDLEEFQEEFNLYSSRLESIDVRFEDRIFYTFTPIDISIDSESE